MTRFRLLLEYDGSGFVGWQRQDNGLSVQEALESAIYDFCGEETLVYGAGRTDAGVHATGMVAHVDIARPTKVETLRDAVNHHLRPTPVAVLEARVAEDSFHARFDAIQRRYLYRIVNRRAPLVLDRKRAWFLPRPLEVEAMVLAARHLVGRHDFEAFRSSQCQAASAVKTLDSLTVTRLEQETGGEEIRIELAARSFLHNQVRIIAGSLCEVGLGRWQPDDMARVLAARDRKLAGRTAPPEGLYLTKVRYPGDEEAG